MGATRPTTRSTSRSRDWRPTASSPCTRLCPRGRRASCLPSGSRRNLPPTDCNRCRRLLGASREAVAIALYGGDGIEKPLPLSKWARGVATSLSASSHRKLGAEPRETSIRSWNSVLVNPGHSAITLTPRGLYSLAAHSEKLLTQALAAL